MARVGVHETQSAAVSENTAATHEIIPGVAGHRIAVYGYILIATGNVSINFEDAGNDDHSGVMDLLAGAGIVAPIGTRPWFRCESGESLYLTLSAAEKVAGHITYELEG